MFLQSKKRADEQIAIDLNGSAAINALIILRNFLRGSTYAFIRLVHQMTQTPPTVSTDSVELMTVFQIIDDALPLRKIEALLDRTNISADAKSIVLEVARCTAVVGGYVIAIGRKIVSFALELAKTIPNTLFGVALALIITALIGGIPVFGAILAGLLKSILLIFGVAQGAIADLRAGDLGRKVENLVAQLAPLKGRVE